MNSSAFLENLKQLFAECDTDKNGSLGREEFSTLCAKIGLSGEAANETFDRLDIDKDDRITFDEFAAGFNQYNRNSSANYNVGEIQDRSASSNSTQSNASDSKSGSPAMHRNQPVAAASINTLRQQQLAPSPISVRSHRKSASPLGVMSLGSAGSSGSSTNNTNNNNTTSSSTGSSSSNSAAVRSGSANTNDLSSASNSCDFSNNLAHVSDSNAPNSLGNCSLNDNNNMIVYSSDMLQNVQNSYSANQIYGTHSDFDAISQHHLGHSSGQFGSIGGLSSSGGGGSLNQFKNMQDLLECVQKLQSENKILTQIFFKDKREREEYISQLGEEFDQQVREVEERASRRAKEELEAEKRRLREMMQMERETLQHHYQTIEKMSNVIKSSTSNGMINLEDGSNGGNLNNDLNNINKVKSKLEDTYLENRKLKRSLLDTKTDVAMIWKEMEKLKRQYEDKLSNAYARNNETRNECDHIKQQLTLMKDSNRKLQDASDVITNYITDKVEPVLKNVTTNNEDENFLNVSSYRDGNGSRVSSRRGSILSEYLTNEDFGCEQEQEGQGKLQMMVDDVGRDKLGKGANGDIESLFEGPDSSLSRSRVDMLDDDSITTNSTSPSALVESNTTPVKGQVFLAEKRSSSYGNENDGDSISSNDRLKAKPIVTSKSSHQLNKPGLKKELAASGEVLNKSATGAQKSSSSSIKNIGRHFFIGSKTKSELDLKESSGNKINSNAAGDGLVLTKSISLDQVQPTDEPLVEPADGPSEATFNVILVGDSFVGKSSFASRFIEGSFVQGLISNCSIDFKTKQYKVDGTNYTVNLWDTAGQERFRSITASYFRKADGIILMYDVTDKRSYLNVRNWMSTIADTAPENVAVLLIGNKIDLRLKSNIQKCVPTEEGFRLAKEYEIVFLETSVKTGANLLPSMGRLIRLIAKNNAPVEEDTDKIRLNDKSKVFNCMGKSC